MNPMQSGSYEPVRVAVIFGAGGNISPVWFEWQRRKHTVLDITYRYEGKRGKSRLLYFIVRDEGGLYELAYNTDDQTWALQVVEAE